MDPKIAALLSTPRRAYKRSFDTGDGTSTVKKGGPEGLVDLHDPFLPHTFDPSDPPHDEKLGENQAPFKENQAPFKENQAPFKALREASPEFPEPTELTRKQIKNKVPRRPERIAKSGNIALTLSNLSTLHTIASKYSRLIQRRDELIQSLTVDDFLRSRQGLDLIAEVNKECPGPFNPRKAAALKRRIPEARAKYKFGVRGPKPSISVTPDDVMYEVVATVMEVALSDPGTVRKIEEELRVRPVKVKE